MGFSSAEKTKRTRETGAAAHRPVDVWAQDARWRVLRSESSDCMWSGATGEVSPAGPSTYVGAFVVLYESIYGVQPEVDEGAALGIAKRWLARFEGDLELAFDCLSWAMSYEVVLRDWVTSCGDRWEPSGIGAVMSGSRYDKWLAESQEDGK